jgi:hypothetical protein
MVEYENIRELYSSRICKCSKNNYKHFLIDPSFRPYFLPLDLCESCMKITKLCEFFCVLIFFFKGNIMIETYLMTRCLYDCW